MKKKPVRFAGQTKAPVEVYVKEAACDSPTISYRVNVISLTGGGSTVFRSILVITSGGWVH